MPGASPGTCTGLAAPGTWEQITPPEALAQFPGPGNCRYGTGSFVVDPSTDAVYLGTCNMGIWKTTDCGSTWVHINTGTNGKTLDTGRQWTFAIDPVDPRVLYTNSGYGAMSNGAFKSIDGGVELAGDMAAQRPVTGGRRRLQLRRPDHSGSARPPALAHHLARGL